MSNFRHSQSRFQTIRLKFIFDNRSSHQPSKSENYGQVTTKISQGLHNLLAESCSDRSLLSYPESAIALMQADRIFPPFRSSPQTGEKFHTAPQIPRGNT